MSKRTPSPIPAVINRRSVKYSDNDFHGLETMPSEHTLEVNGTSQQLAALSSVFERCTATAPSRSEEGGSNDELGEGYDISLDVAKEIVFQYKKPKRARVRGPSSRQCQWLLFKVNMEQVYTLALLYAPGEAFIACPVITDPLLLSETLERTVYVDVYTILLQTLLQRRESRYIAVEYRPESDPSPYIVVKYATGKYSMDDGLGSKPYYKLKERKKSGQPAAYSWSELETKIKSCDYGLPIRGIEPDSTQNKLDSLSLNPDEYPESFDNLPDGYETLGELFGEIQDRFNPAYQSHLARRFTLDAFARTDDGELRHRYARILLTSLQERIRMGREHRRIKFPEQTNLDQFDEDLGIIDELQSVENTWAYENILAPRTEMSNPLTRGVSRSGHHILQRSNDT